MRLFLAIIVVLLGGAVLIADAAADASARPQPAATAAAPTR